jgi:anti-sigma regulatory factor (Ser/Thr protein kinase)
MHTMSIAVGTSGGEASLARHAVERAMGAWSELPLTRIEDAKLLTSELTANAVRHAGLVPGDAIGLAIDAWENVLRVEVADGGPGFDAQELPGPGPDGGYGLHLVEQIADRWGVIRDRTNRVWFELDLY